MQGSLSKRDYDLYQLLYRKFSANLPKPDLTIYLQAEVPTLISRIESRNREFEQSVPVKYITQLNDLYDEWASEFSFSPVLTIKSDDLNVVRNPADYEFIKEEVISALG